MRYNTKNFCSAGIFKACASSRHFKPKSRKRKTYAQRKVIFVIKRSGSQLTKEDTLGQKCALLHVAENKSGILKSELLLYYLFTWLLLCIYFIILFIHLFDKFSAWPLNGENFTPAHAVLIMLTCREVSIKCPFFTVPGVIFCRPAMKLTTLIPISWEKGPTLARGSASDICTMYKRCNNNYYTQKQEIKNLCD